MDATAVMEPTAPIVSQRIGAWPVRMALVLGLAGVLFFARLSERSLWSEEVRWAEIPREMQQNGNYLWPTINGRTYYDKPLGSYWLVLLASIFTGEVNETSARLPSALSGLCAVAFAMLIARRLYDDGTALWSGVILATSFSFVFFARNASTDIETIAGVLAALWIFLRHEADPPGWWTLVLWFVMALTSLTKGLLGFALPLLIIGLYSLAVAREPNRSVEINTNPKRQRGTPWTLAGASGWYRFLVECNGWVFNRWSLAAIPLGLSVYLAPFVLSILAGGSTDGLEMVYRENVRRFFDPVNHRGPIYLYAYVIFMLLAPWSLLLPAALVHAHTTDDKTCKGRAFALAYFWGTFVFFTLSASRRSYYLLPILPAAAFLIARLLTERERLGRVASALLRTGFVLMGLTVLASLAALMPAEWFLPEPLNRLPELPSPWAFIGAWLISMGCLGYAMVKSCPRRIAGCFAGIAFSFLAYLYLFALPATEVYRTQQPFANAVRETIGPNTDQLALYRTREIVFYLNVPNPVAEYHTPEDVQRGLSKWIIARRHDWQNLGSPGKIVLAETVHPWQPAAASDKLLLIEIPSARRLK